MKALLVEDDVVARDLFTGYITETPGLVLGGIARDGEEALRKLGSGTYDLLFLDIDLPLKSGLEVLEELDEIPYLIFITASSAHAVRAFDMGAIDYLHKPVSRERFAKAVEKALRFFRENPPEKQTEAPAPPAKKGERKSSTTGAGLVISEEGNHYLIPHRRIIYLSAHDRHTVIHTLDRDFETIRILGDLEKRLPGDRFLRIHRKYILNLAFVSHTRYLIGGRYTVSLNDPDETELTVARSFVPEFKRVLGL